jgi:hypothetical protein
VSPVKYELGYYTPEDDILHSNRRENFKPYKVELLSGCSNTDKSVPCFLYISPTTKPQPVDHNRQYICLPK